MSPWLTYGLITLLGIVAGLFLTRDRWQQLREADRRQHQNDRELAELIREIDRDERKS